MEGKAPVVTEEDLAEHSCTRLVVEGKAPVVTEEDLAEHSCTRLVVEGKAPVVRPGKTWQNTHVLG